MIIDADLGLKDLVTLLPSDLGRPIVLSKGEQIFATDDPALGLFQVQSGLVHLVRHAIDGSEVTLHIARSGQFFAEASLFTDRYHCDAIADLPTTLLAFDKEQVLAELGSNPDRALRWIDHLSRQVQNLRSQVARLSLKTADDGVLSFLRMQCLDGSVVRIDRPWKRIASELGLTHEALYRTLAKLERQGVIKRNRENSTVEITSDRSR